MLKNINIYFFSHKIYCSNFIKQHSETVMVLKLPKCRLQLKKKNIVSLTIILLSAHFRSLCMQRAGKPQLRHCWCVQRWVRSIDVTDAAAAAAAAGMRSCWCRQSVCDHYHQLVMTSLSVSLDLMTFHATRPHLVQTIAFLSLFSLFSSCRTDCFAASVSRNLSFTTNGLKKQKSNIQSGI